MSNLLKSASINVKDDGKRIINSNDLIAQKIEKLTTELLEMETEDEFADGFTEGLEAEQVEALLSDPDAEDERIRAARESAAEIVENANAEAEDIINSANEERENILNNAVGEVQELKNAAASEGHEEGYRAGYDEGMKEIEALKEQIEAERTELREEYDRKYEALEPELVGILTDIYEHVLGISLSDNSEIVLNLMKETIRNIEGGKNYMIHVSTDDYAYVSAYREDLFNCVGGIDTLEVVEDITLKRSDCFIECESGIYDCSLGTELGLLKKELRLLSYRRKEG
ncbi:MAG: hypothetical protein K6B28_00880 [Lachnospiraceae bacterium]|nr:hypothetical protein [Lachnospiraceae bacterium]